MSIPLVPLSLNGIFDRTFRLIGKTFLRNLIIGAVFIIPGAAIFAWGLQLVLGGLTGVLNSAMEHQRFSWDMLQPLMGGFLIFLLMAFSFFILEIIAYLGAMYVVGSEIAGSGAGWLEAIQVVLSGRVLKVILQAILQTLAMIGIMLFPYAGLIAGAVTQTVWLALLMIPILAAGWAGIIYLSIAWLFAQPSIVWEDVGIIESFGRSLDLVYGNWWRTFGIYLLMSLVVGLAISIVSTPVSFLALWPFISKYAQLFQPMHETIQPTAEQVVGLFSEIGVGVGILIAVNGILQAVTMPVYLMVMYFDLRARHGDFPDSAVSGDPQHVRPLIG